MVESSERWKTGTIFGVKPTVYADVTDGSRFRNWPEVCGPATEAEGKDLRVVLHGWTDECTPVESLSKVAPKLTN